MMAGRPALSDGEAWLKGSRSKSAGARESVFAFGRPKKPKDLSPVASAEWDRVVKQLIKRKVSTALDASALESYCRTFALWRGFMIEAELNPMIDEPVLDKNGVVHQRHITNPAAKHCMALGNLLARYQREFSATPASRETTRPTAPPAPPKNAVVPGSVEDLMQQRAALAQAERENAPEYETTPEEETNDLLNDI
jgi:phage terminase small subunit